jgi:hypothetical protein
VEKQSPQAQGRGAKSTRHVAWLVASVLPYTQRKRAKPYFATRRAAVVSGYWMRCLRYGFRFASDFSGFPIAGIDVRKKKLAVVLSDVEIESEYQFERRMFGSNPEQLRSLAAWLLEPEAEEAVIESTAQYWKPVWEALEKARSEVRNVASGAGAVQSHAVGTQERFRRCRTPGEAPGGPGIDPWRLANRPGLSIALPIAYFDSRSSSAVRRSSVSH